MRPLNRVNRSLVLPLFLLLILSSMHSEPGFARYRQFERSRRRGRGGRIISGRWKVE